MDAESAIQEAQKRAKRQCIIDRLLDWIERADEVNICHEIPEMVPESCARNAEMIATGNLTIVLDLQGVWPDLGAGKKPGGPGGEDKS